MDARPLAVLTTAPLLALCLVAAPASAAPPTIERQDVDFSFADEDLSARCGFPVEGRLAGKITSRTFDRGGRTGPVAVTTVNFDVTLSSPYGSLQLHDVGADVVRMTPGGTMVLSIIGQTFEFKGVLKIDLATGDVLHEPQRETDFGALCQALAA